MTLTTEYIDSLATTISDYSKALLKSGMDPYITLQLALGLQSTLIQKAIETYAVPGWPQRDPNNGKKDNSGNSGEIGGDI